MLSLTEKLSVHLYKQLALTFQQKAIVLILVAMATDFEHNSNCSDEFYKPVKFQANTPLRKVNMRTRRSQQSQGCNWM